MASAPRYSIDDTVYIRESAALGHLEVMRITSIIQTRDGIWLYQATINKKPPANKTVGDRNDLKVGSFILQFPEDELITVCEALDLVIAFHTAQRNVAIARRNELCEGSE